MNFNHYFCNLDQVYLMAINALTINTTKLKGSIYPGILIEIYGLQIYMGKNEDEIQRAVYITTKYHLLDRNYRHSYFTIYSEFSIFEGEKFKAPLITTPELDKGNLIFIRKVAI